MAKVISTHKGVKAEHDLPDSPGGFTVIVHQQGIRVDVPDFVEINSRNTINCMEQMSEAHWKWISKGETFKILFRLAFRDQPEITVPETLKELIEGDMGVTHVAGMIVLGCEAVFEKNNIFFRNPENGLHPRTERCIVTMFKAMMLLAGLGGTVEETEEVVEVVDEKPKKKKRKKKKKEEEATKEEDTDFADKYVLEEIKKVAAEVCTPDTRSQEEKDKANAIEWLNAYKEQHDGDKILGRFGENFLTVNELIVHVQNDTDIGKQMIVAFIKKKTGQP